MASDNSCICTDCSSAFDIFVVIVISKLRRCHWKAKRNLRRARGVNPLWGHDAFPSVSDFPLFSTNFKTLWKISKMLPFPEKTYDFHTPKFLIFHILVHFPLFRENRYFPPVFEKFTCFLHALCVFRFHPTLTMMHLCITQCTYWTPLCTESRLCSKVVSFEKK